MGKLRKHKDSLQLMVRGPFAHSPALAIRWASGEHSKSKMTVHSDDNQQNAAEAR